MEAKRLMKVTYQDLKKGIRLNAYADAVIWSEDPSPTLAGLRFGGYAEVVRGLTDAIYGGATIEIEDADGSLLTLKSLSKQYHREVSHEGLYAEATLIAEDEIQESSKSQDEKSSKHAQKDDLFDDNVPQQDIPPHICYIFCHPGNEDELFQAIDQKSYVPMIPEYQDYVLAELKRRRILRPLRVRSLYQELEAWKLCCEAKDQNLVKVMEDGLKQGKIKIPGAAPGPSLLDGVHSVTDYTNEGKTIHIPTISFFSASNEIPNFTNSEEKILKPLYDRFELKVVTEYVEDRAARLKILKQKQAAPHLAQAPAAPITLEELEAMQDDVRQVHIPDSVNELMDDVLCALREKGIHISDRKYFNYAPVAQAKAWLEGRDTVAPADLIILRHYLWTAPEERAIIQSALVQMCSDPFKNRLDGILAAVQESYQEFEDDSGAAPARRIGKLREEYLMLYEKLSAMRTEVQDDIGRQKVDACMEELEAFNKKAFSEDGVSGVFSYVPLKELYLLKAN